MNKNKKDANTLDKDKQDIYNSEEYITNKLGDDVNHQKRIINLEDQLYSPGYKHNDYQDDKYDYISMNSFSLDFNNSFDEVAIYLASPSDIYSISKGEVTSIDTLNYRTLKPEKNGIFCAAIFGPTENYKCQCGRYCGDSYKGLKCERCGVVIGDRRLRRIYFGHIELNAMVVHPWFHNYAASILKMTKKIFNGIINYEMFVFVNDTKDGKFLKYQILTASKYYSSDIYYEELVSGGEAIYYLLEELNIDEELSEIKELIKGKKLCDVSEKLLKRRDILNAIKHSNRPITNVILRCLPIVPADIRPIIHLEAGGIATSEINDHYRKCIARNARLERIQSMAVHPVIVNNDGNLLTKAIHELYGPQPNKKTKSIADLIKGKKGYFRRALLGKRTDFSGRGSIVVGPELKIDECSIPYHIALYLCKPLLYSVAMKEQKVYNLLDAKRLVESGGEYVFRKLEEIIKDNVIILNRAPSLHRLSVQAFKPRINRSHAIKIPALVCAGYAADFDGDQMACHIPITIASKIEVFSLMLSRHNLFLPVNGSLIVTPTKDIVLGLYYASLLSESRYEKNILSIYEANMLYEFKYINSNTVIKARIKDMDGINIYETSFGRIQIWNFVSKYCDLISFKVFNKIFNKNHIHASIMHVFENVGWDATIDFLNDITQFGFNSLTKSGISYSMKNVVTLDMKTKLQEVDDTIDKLYNYFKLGFITEEEYFTQYMQNWHNFIESNSSDVLDAFKNNNDNSNDLNNVGGNNIYLIYASGARGSASQMQQVSGLRGFMSKMSGQVSKFLIRSNLSSGLNCFEFFESANGERKSLVDTACKTSIAGHLTRRLVDINHSVVINKKDCNTDKYLIINKIQDKRQFNLNFKNAIVGKVLANSVINDNNDTIARKGDIITNKIFELIDNSNVQEIHVYSSLYCNEDFGVCAKCYGVDFSTHKLINVGCPVGMLAAQSVGEPGTQLTMRTTHTGGVASTSSIQEEIYASCNGQVDLSEISTGINQHGETIVLLSGYFIIKNEKGIDRTLLNHGFVLNKKHNDIVSEGDIIASINKSIHRIVSMYTGRVKFFNIIPDITVKETYDSFVGIYRRKVISSIQYSDKILNPAIVILDDTSSEEFYYYLDEGYMINVQDGEYVSKGYIIATKYFKNISTHDITGGLPKVIDIFEAKTYNNAAIMATKDGIIKITRHKKNKYIYIKEDGTGKILDKIIVSNNRNIIFQDGIYATKGSILVDGKINLQNMLDIMGYDETIKYILSSVSTIYEDQGVDINYKHIEIVVKQMMKYGVITETESELYPLGKVMEYKQLLAIDQTIHKCSFKRLVLGITKVSLNYYPSFISASSFQHTIPTISWAALNYSRDLLRGIKERIVFNKKISVGTGFTDFIIDK
ncbi:DNA-directed RNA polymerase subunit beta' [uncultured bacterium]|nr:DNA-directed RNA polymerase subunit beta' [uncultured bacterium]